MPIIGSSPNKTFQRTDGTRTGSEVWQEAKTAAVKIRADAHDTHDEDIGDAISACVFKDGSNFSADMPLNTHKFTGVENASARTHFAAAGQVQDGAFHYVAAAGTGDAITLDLTPSITAYAAGQAFRFKATATNTGATTANVDGVGAVSVKKGPDGATALAAGDITSGGLYTIVHDGTNFQIANAGLARNVSAFAATILDDADAAAVRTTLAVPSTTEAVLVANNLSDVTAATAFGNIKQAASDAATGVIEIAIQSEMETASSTTLAVTPGRQHFHPSAAKFWLRADGGGSPSLTESYNVTSISDAGTGLMGITIATDFSTDTWCAIGGSMIGAIVLMCTFGSQLAGSIQAQARRGSDSDLLDPNDWRVVGFGDHA